MKNDRLSSCLGDIDDKFIDEAADYKKKSRRRGVYYLASALAACVIIALAGADAALGEHFPAPRRPAR